MTAEADVIPDEALAALWPALASRTALFTADEALPDADVDLGALAALPVPGPKGPTWAGRHRNMPRHFRALQPEFAAAPRIAHLLACVIVALRRDGDNARARTLFTRITADYGTVVAQGMNLRWLTSVCDTFCDIGDPVERATALNGSLAANLVKLAETERKMFAAPRPWPPATKFSMGGPLFDGVIAYWVGKGDMIDNLLDRADRVLSHPNAAAPFVREVMVRLGRHDTVLRRMLSVNDGRTVPLAEREQVQAARSVMKDL